MSGGLEVSPSFLSAHPSAAPSLKTSSILEGESLEISWTLPKAADSSFSIDWVVSGTGASGDFTVLTGSIPVSVGQTSINHQIPVLNNALYRGDRTYTLVLSSSALSSSLSFPVTVKEDEAKPVVKFASAAQSVNEGVASQSAQIEITPASELAIEVDYTVSGTATLLLDLTGLTSSRLTIPAGATSASIDFNLVDDAVAESSETVILQLTQIASGTAELGATTTHTATIVDNETVNLTISDATVSEGGIATFTATLSTASTLPVSFTWSTSDGTGDSVTTYHSGSGTIIIPALSTTATFTVNTRDNSTVCEPSKTFSVSLASVSGATLVDGVGEATVSDPDRPTVAFVTSSSSVTEGNSASVAVALSAVCSLYDVKVRYATQDGSATSGSDYTAALSSAEATIPAGQLSTSIGVATSSDASSEAGGETFSVVLSSPTNAALGATVTHVVTINDPVVVLPTLSIADVSTAEGTNAAPMNLTFTVTLSQASASPVTVDYATSDGTATTAGNDYVAKTGTLSIPAGQTSGTFTVSVIRDNLEESDEAFNVTLSGGSGYTATGSDLAATATLTNDDTLPSVSFTVASENIVEGGSVTITAQLSRASSQAVSVTAAKSGTAIWSSMAMETQGADIVGGGFGGTALLFSFPAGTTSVTKTFDADFCGGAGEGHESFILTLGTPTNAVLGTGTNSVHTTMISDSVNDDNSCNLSGGSGGGISETPTIITAPEI